MNLSKRACIAILALIMLTVFSLGSFAAGQKDSGTPYIAVVSKGEQHDFWQQVKLGATAAAAELGVSMTFEGPASESDVQDQVEMLNVALAKAPAAIALAALDTNSVIDQLIEARNRKIPVIGFDSGVPEAPEGSIYANASTDNYNAAGVAAEKMFEVIGDKIKGASAANPVKIVVMNQDASGESLLSRGRGFRDRMVELVVSQAGLAKSDIKVMGNPAYIASDSPTSGNKVMIEMVVPASASASDSMAACHSRSEQGGRSRTFSVSSVPTKQPSKAFWQPPTTAPPCPNSIRTWWLSDMTPELDRKTPCGTATSSVP